jgi:1-acyl-sn-glycerol-3-phosphate acyltransferase
LRPFYFFCYACSKAICRVAFRLSVEGREHVPESAAFIAASNHIGYFDPVIVACALGREICFLARAELFDQFFVKDLIKKLNAFPIRRGERDVAAIKTCIAILGEKRMPLLMFPEGTRSRTGRLGEPRRGIAFIAARTRVPILPVYIENSDRLGECFRLQKRLIVRIGRPLYPTEYGQLLTRREGYGQLTRLVMSEIWKLKRATVPRPSSSPQDP